MIKKFIYALTKILIFNFFNHAKKSGTGIIYNKYLLNIQ
jgi:hypothetical protein